MPKSTVQEYLEQYFSDTVPMDVVIFVMEIMPHLDTNNEVIKEVINRMLVERGKNHKHVKELVEKIETLVNEPEYDEPPKYDVHYHRF